MEISSNPNYSDGASEISPMPSPTPAPKRPAVEGDTESSTMPLSSPVNKSLSQSQEAMPPPALPRTACDQMGRKRSFEEANAVSQDEPQSAASAAVKDAPPDTQNGQHEVATNDSSATIVPVPDIQHGAAHVQDPLSPTQSRSSSRQGDANAQKSSSMPFKSSGSADSTASTFSRSDPHPTESEDGSDASSSTGALPDEAIEQFEWDALEMRYHEEAEQFRLRELAILKEFKELGKFFNVWAQVGCSKEIDRGFKRLKTQQAFVQKQEDALEAKRQHYVLVVDAFTLLADVLRGPEEVGLTALKTRRGVSTKNATTTELAQAKGSGQANAEGRSGQLSEPAL